MGHLHSLKRSRQRPGALKLHLTSALGHLKSTLACLTYVFNNVPNIPPDFSKSTNAVSVDFHSSGS